MSPTYFANNLEDMCKCIWDSHPLCIPPFDRLAHKVAAMKPHAINWVDKKGPTDEVMLHYVAFLHNVVIFLVLTKNKSSGAPRKIKAWAAL